MQANLASKIWIQNKANNETTMNQKAKVTFFLFLFLTETNLWLSLRLVKMTICGLQTWSAYYPIPRSDAAIAAMYGSGK